MGSWNLGLTEKGGNEFYLRLDGALVYRLGHGPLKAERRVQFPCALPSSPPLLQAPLRLLLPINPVLTAIRDNDELGIISSGPFGLQKPFQSFLIGSQDAERL